VAKNEKPVDKEKALQLGIDAIQKQYGKGSIVIGGSNSFPEIERIPSGSLALNMALSGGYAKGRLVEIYGPESSGKTTLALHSVVECQRQGGKCAFIDMEHALDVDYATGIGVDVDKLIISQPSCGEEALNIAEHLARTGAVDLIIIDSVAALVPKKEVEGDIGDTHVGSQARLMSQACRKLASVASQTHCTIIFINQIRMKIGVMFGSPETTSGGNALKFFSSQRLDIRRTNVVKQGDDRTGIESTVKVVKSKVGRPFQHATFNIMFGQGIDWAKDILDLAVERNLVDKSGSWYSYQGTKIGQGTHNASQYLRDHPELVEELKSKITQ